MYILKRSLNRAPFYSLIFLSYDEEPRVIGIIVGNFMPLEDSL